MRTMVCGLLLLSTVSTQCQPTHRSTLRTELVFADDGLAGISDAGAVLAVLDRERDVRLGNKPDSQRLATNRRANGSSAVAPSSGKHLPRRLMHYENITVHSGNQGAGWMAGGLKKQNSRQRGNILNKTQPWLTACAGWGRNPFAANCDPLPALNVTLWQSHSAGSSTNAFQPQEAKGGGNGKEKFHWGPALWQSLEFLLIEHGFRIATDPYARHLLLHRPLWHDYFASSTNFQNQWGDGDDFIVNYIGHPLQGSVTGNIFIQNDPKGRVAKFGKSSDYWTSRLKALAWAAAYSTYFEIGPILSETAIGNQGGYTYIPNCGFYPTCKKVPGRHYKPPTNNTGYVDFVVTPTIGMGWIVLEDFIERDVVDRIANGRQSLKFNILRGALAPSRTMSNLLAGKLPWYRPSDEKQVLNQIGNLVQSPKTSPSWKNEARWDLTIQVINLNLPKPRKGCLDCRDFSPGAGVEVGYRMARYVYLSSEFNIFPGAGAGNEKRSAQEGLFGVRVGRSVHSWQLSAQGRPGFIRYEKATLTGNSIDYESTMRFVWDLGGSVDYKTSPSSAIRFKLGTNIVRWPSHSDLHQPPLSVLSDEYVAAQGSFYFTGGYVFRF